MGPEFHAACKLAEQKLHARIAALESSLAESTMRENLHNIENQNLIKLLTDNGIDYTANIIMEPK